MYNNKVIVSLKVGENNKTVQLSVKNAKTHTLNYKSTGT